MSNSEPMARGVDLSPEPAQDKIRVRIVALSDMTEIAVSDARFNIVPLPGNAGQVEVDLPEGVYQVAFRDGTSWQRQTILLRRGPGPQPIVVSQKDPGPLRSALPLDEPVGGLEAMPPVLAKGLEALPAAPDRGLSEVTVIVRDVPRPDPERGGQTGPADVPSPEWLAGLSLVAATDHPATGSEVAVPQRAIGLRYHVAPGPWRLRLETGISGHVLEMPLIVCPGWRTRVHLPLRSYGEARSRRADFTAALVRMLPPWDDSAVDNAARRRLEANALQSLAQGRSLHGRRFNEMLHNLLTGKFNNPMLGLYAGHLLPCRDEEEQALLEEVVRNLSEWTEKGPERSAASALPFPHPDVLALGLRLALLKNEPSRLTGDFSFPPMLTASWEVMLEAARRKPELVPSGSLTDQVAGRLWGPSAWVVWEQPPPAPAATRGLESLGVAKALAFEARAPEATPLPVPEACDVIDAALGHREIRDWVRTTTELDNLERLLAQTIHPLAADESMQQTLERLLRSPGRALQETARRPWTLERVAAVLRVPASTAERTVHALCAQLKKQAERHHST